MIRAEYTQHICDGKMQHSVFCEDTLPEAKVAYRAVFGGKDEYRAQEFINKCVEEL